jgi:hypothetical protein
MNDDLLTWQAELAACYYVGISLRDKLRLDRLVAHLYALREGWPR